MYAQPTCGLEFVELKAQSEIDSVKLRARAGEFPGRGIDLRFLVRKAGKEAAFLWYDVFPPEFHLVLYELFVAAKFRRRGIGSALIQHAEALALDRGYKRILVHPQPLSDQITQPQLIAWYEKRGFTCVDAERGTYGKDVSTSKSWPADRS